MAKLTIFLRTQESDALQALAAHEYRDPRAQAAYIIRRELARNGLIPLNQDNQPGPDIQTREAEPCHDQTIAS